MNILGLSEEKITPIVDKLNVLLANYQVLYTNVRGFHWNIKGKNFFELHLKFEEIYNDLQIKIDEIAERILTLGGTPNNSFSTYLQHTSIKEISNQKDGVLGLESILESFQTILKLERELLNMTSDIYDEGTNSLISGYVTEHEKSIWMFSSYLNK